MQAALIMEGGFFMATTRLMPLHTGKGRTVGTAISDIIDYVQNPQKTDNGRLITSYQCDSRIADAEFLFNKRQYIAATGRLRGEDDVIAYPLSPVRSRRKKQTGWAVSWRGASPRGNTPSLSALTLIENTSITTSFSMPPPWTINGSFGIFGAAPALSGGSMIPSALRTDTLL